MKAASVISLALIAGVLMHWRSTQITRSASRAKPTTSSTPSIPDRNVSQPDYRLFGP
jgi:hypothetical protein